MDIKELERRIKEGRNHISAKRGELSLIEKQIQSKINEKEKLKKENERILTMKGLIDDACKEARDNGRELLSQVATSSVQAVYGENTSVQLEPCVKDGITSIEVIVNKKVEGGVVRINPRNSDGGGLADIVSLSIFMALGQLVNNNYAPKLLDEPTKYVSQDRYASNSANFILNMVKYTGRQTIMSTHDKAIIDCEGILKRRLTIDEETGETIMSVM